MVFSGLGEGLRPSLFGKNETLALHQPIFIRSLPLKTRLFLTRLLKGTFT